MKFFTARNAARFFVAAGLMWIILPFPAIAETEQELALARKEIADLKERVEEREKILATILPFIASDEGFFLEENPAEMMKDAVSHLKSKMDREEREILAMAELEREELFAFAAKVLNSWSPYSWIYDHYLKAIDDSKALQNEQKAALDKKIHRFERLMQLIISAETEHRKREHRISRLKINYALLTETESAAEQTRLKQEFLSLRGETVRCFLQNIEKIAAAASDHEISEEESWECASAIIVITSEQFYHWSENYIQRHCKLEEARDAPNSPLTWPTFSEQQMDFSNAMKIAIKNPRDFIDSKMQLIDRIRRDDTETKELIRRGSGPDYLNAKRDLENDQAKLSDLTKQLQMKDAQKFDMIR